MNISPLTKRIALVNFSVNFSVFFFVIFFPVVLCYTCLEKNPQTNPQKNSRLQFAEPTKKISGNFSQQKKSEKFTLGLLLCEGMSTVEQKSGLKARSTGECTRVFALVCVGGRG